MTSAPATGLDPAPVAEVADGLMALLCSLGRAKARFAADADHEAEWSTHLLLRHLAGHGPLRASAVAEQLHADPSTVSRQVATLVREGLIERRADPEDGRASNLVVTARADRVLAERAERRQEHLAAMLADWSDADLRRFAGLLRNFTDDFDRFTTATNSERAASRPRSTEGHH